MKSKLFRLLALVSMLSMLAAPVSAQPFAGATATATDVAVQTPPDSDKLSLEPATAVANPGSGLVIADKNATGTAIYIVQFADAPLASYRGGISGLEATNASIRGEARLDLKSEASAAYLAYLDGQHSAFLSEVSATLGRSAAVKFEYKYAFNGVAIELSPGEAAQVAALPGVRQVQRESFRYIQTDYGPEWMGADGIWDGTATGGLPGTQGEGVTVGIIDTGLNLGHPSFAAVGPSDGYTHTNPLGSGTYLGLCDSDPGTYVCNDKLIGYYIFTGETTEDGDGHGSHTGSTTAGNVLDAGIVDLTPFPYSPAISGVAPHANVIGYDGCLDDGGCPFSALTAAIDQTVADGVVDVINYSIGGGSSDPWTDADSLAFLGAADAGIVPVTSASNSGPGAGTVGSPADAPWMLAVGASTHNRAGLNSVESMSGGDTTPPADILGKGFSAGYGPAAIVYAGDYGDAICLNPFPAGTFSGEIVLCDRGTNARVAKGYNVLQGGGGGMVLANDAANGPSLNGDVHHLPAVHISFDDGVVMKAWLASGTGHTGTIAGTTIDLSDSNGDIMAGFSSRGPNINTAPDIIKPDVTAPGVDILAAYRANPPSDEHPTSNYAIISGTSMSSPHTAGAAALMKALHPDWSPAEIKSALMSTATTAGVLKEDGSTPADPFDMGGGRVDLSMAGQAGLVLDESTADFLAADPGLGGQPKDLNLASLGEDQCLLSCTWTREVTNPQGFTTTWEAVTSAPAGMTLTVTPSTFSLAPSASQVLTITADVSSMPVDQWAFAEVTLQPTMAYLQVAHLAPFAADPGTAVTVTLNSTAVLTDFAFADSTGYIPVPAGSYLVEIFPGGSSTAAISDTLMVSSGTDYTVIAVGDGVNQALDLVALVDDNSAPAAGNAKLRIGHLAPFASGAATADVRLEDGSPVITDVVYGAVAPYLSLPEAMYDLRITAPGGEPTLINPLAVGLNDGDILSAFAVGDGSNQALGVFALPSGKPGFLLPLYLGAELYLPLVPRNDGGALAAPANLGVEDYSHITAALLNNANAVPPAHFPVAVRPTTGTVPDHVDILTRRDAGSKTLADLTAIEITDLTVDAYGLTQAALTTQLLDQDPTNGDPYDTITGTFYVTTTVPSGAIRLVAETYDSTAVDMDLFVGTGDTPSAGTEVCSSTTATAFEYCDIAEPAAGTWWVLVQNWDDSASPPDAVTLAYGVVPGTDAGNMTVVGPSSQPELDPFDLTIYYDEPGMTAGDRWYGAFDLGSDAGSPGNIARVTVDVQRYDDDVSKAVSDDTPDFSDTLTYTITVLPNITGVDLTYALTDTIPAGLTYVGGSAAANFGTVNVVGDTLTWTGVMPGKGSYVVETSMTDPVGCIMPLANSGAYVNLEGYGIDTDPGISGDSVWYSFNPSGGEFEFFGENQGEVINFTDDGFAFFDPSTPGATPFANEPIPTAGDPDNLMSIFWRDLEIVYDAGLNRGVSLANLTSGGVPSAAIVEYDDVEDWPAGSGTTYDVEMLARYFADPGWYEYIFAYDNLNGNVLTGTIGLENASGTDGAEYAYDNIAVTDGMAVCFDYSDPTTPAEITYQVTIDGIGMLTNDVVSTTDDPGSMPESTSVTVDVVGGPAIDLTKTVGTDPNVCATTGDIIVGPGTNVTYCYEVENTGTLTLTLHDLVDTELGAILDDFAFSLTPGATAFVTETANILTTTVNTATWTAFNAGPVDVASDSDSATVTVNPPAPLVCNGPTVGFNVGVPFDWVVADNEMTGVVWTSVAASGEAGNYTGGAGGAASVSSDAFGAAEFDTELWSPPFDTTGYVTVTLDYLANYQNYLNLDFLDVDISTDGGSSWTTLLSWNEDHGTFRGTPGEAVSIDLSSYAGSTGLILRWHYYDPNTGDWDWYAQIDNASLTCVAP